MLFRKKHIPSSLSDQELISKFKTTEDPVWVGELFKRYTGLIFGTCMKYLKHEENSKDAVMNIFEKLIEELKKHDISNFKGWLHTLSKNYCLMELRKKNPVVLKEIDADDMEISYRLHPVIEEEHELNLQQMEQGIKILNQEQKICIELFYLEERSYKEIAESTGYSLNEIKSHIQNGKRNLKNYLVKKNV